jgi:hypothetical protein
MSRPLDLVGQKLGRLTVVSRSDSTADGRSLFLCACECGRQVVAIGKDLRRGHTKSCGCLSKETTSKTKRIHGESRPQTPEFRAWKAMLTRCTNERQKCWKDYGGRGIKVCYRWANSYDNFLADMGRKPTPQHSLDRYPNNDGDYEPANCRWATRKEQNSNTRATLRTLSP